MRWLIGILLLVVWTDSLGAETIELSDVAFNAQSPPGDWANNMNCGPATVLILGAHHNGFLPASADLVNLLDWLYAEGIIKPQSQAEYYDGNVTNIRQLERTLTEYFSVGEVERRNNNDLDYLRAELSKGNPVIVGVNINMNTRQIGHFMVVVGMTDNQVIVHDPGKANGAYNRYGLAQFQSSWATSNYASMVISSSEAVWYPNGSLLQVRGSSRVYLVEDGLLYWITNEGVFNANHFDWQKIILVSSEVLDCMEYGGEFDDLPYRELYQSGGAYFLYEKPSFIARTCTVSRFVSRVALNSWQLPLEIRRRSSIEELTKSCMHGATLYFRDGTLVRPTESRDFGSGVILVATNNGELRPFINWETFQLMGYEDLPLFLVTEEDLNIGTRVVGSPMTHDVAFSCSLADYQIWGQPSVEVDEDGDGVSVELGDCDDHNPNIYIGAIETCDLQDNDCNGEIDDGLIEECRSSCGRGWHYCQDGHWNGCDIYEFVEEVEDGIDNDCDGLVDEGFVIPEDSDPLDQDNDHDGYSINQGDCDDWSPDQNPGHPELCDDLDNNCNRLIDEDNACETLSDVHCSIECPEGMLANIWYGSFGWREGNPLVVDLTIDELCLRGEPWIDFNCVCPEWSCFDWTVATVDCSEEFQVHEGLVDFVGEGEVWFSTLSCE